MVNPDIWDTTLAYMQNPDSQLVPLLREGHYLGADRYVIFPSIGGTWGFGNVFTPLYTGYPAWYTPIPKGYDGDVIARRHVLASIQLLMAPLSMVSPEKIQTSNLAETQLWTVDLMSFKQAIFYLSPAFVRLLGDNPVLPGMMRASMEEASRQIVGGPDGRLFNECSAKFENNNLHLGAPDNAWLDTDRSHCSGLGGYTLRPTDVDSADSALIFLCGFAGLQYKLDGALQ